MSTINAPGADYLFDSASSLFSFDDAPPPSSQLTPQSLDLSSSLQFSGVPEQVETGPLPMLDESGSFFGREAALEQSNWFSHFSDRAWDASDAIRADTGQPGWLRDAVSLTQPVLAVGLGTLGLANDVAVAIKDPSLLAEPLRHPLDTFEHAKQGIGDFFSATNPFRQAQTLITNFADPAMAGVHVAGQMGRLGRTANDLGTALATDTGRALTRLYDEGALTQPLRSFGPKGLWGSASLLLPDFAAPLYAAPPRVHGLDQLFNPDNVSVQLNGGRLYEDGHLVLGDQPLTAQQVWQLSGGFGNSTVTVFPPIRGPGYGVTSIGNGGTVPYFALSGWTDRPHLELTESIVRFSDKTPDGRQIDLTQAQPVLPFGVGTQATINQLESGRSLGFESVYLLAAQRPASDYVGLAVWPKLGFDGLLDPDQLPAGLLSQYLGGNGMIRISDVISDPAGRAGWADSVASMVEHSNTYLRNRVPGGYASEPLSFDLSPGSVSEQILNDTVDRMNASITDVHRVK